MAILGTWAYRSDGAAYNPPISLKGCHPPAVLAGTNIRSQWLPMSQHGSAWWWECIGNEGKRAVLGS